MTRYIEDIVGAYQASQERKAKGLPSWKYTIKLKHLLKQNDDPGVCETAEITQGIAKILRSAIPPKKLDMTSDEYDEDIEGFIESFEELTEERLKEIDEAGENPIDRFNEIMEDLYLWADYERVWID